MWTPAIVFEIQRRRLRRLGYRTHSFSYPSVRGDLDDVADALARRIDALDAERVFLVGHSLGGLVLLTMLARHRSERVRRAVLLGSPCRDSHCARRMLRHPQFGGLIGRPLRQWLERPLPDPVGMPEVGVVAGNRPIGIAGKLFKLPLPNDGVVTVSETRWPWATDTITLRLTHMQMLTSAECLRKTVRFLETGAFVADRHVESGQGGQG